MKTALLISTYNWPQALKLVLKSLKIQTSMPDEVLIADDGSDERTKHVIENFQKKISVQIRHIWQEDNGFRKSAILNKAIASSNADYIIQIDGDCIMHSHFIEDHLSLAKENVFLFGSRVNIKPGEVQAVFEKEINSFSVFSKSIKNRTRNFRIPLLRDRYNEKNEFSPKTRGCNISFWKKDFIEVNGYNEQIEGWGREDSEMVLRMLNKGVAGKRLRYGGIVYHIFHKSESKSQLNENNKIELQTINEERKWCAEGVEKYLESVY